MLGRTGCSVSQVALRFFPGAGQLVRRMLEWVVVECINLALELLDLV